MFTEENEVDKKTEELIAHLLETYFLPEVLEYMKWAKERDEKLYRRIKERCLMAR